MINTGTERFDDEIAQASTDDVLINTQLQLGVVSAALHAEPFQRFYPTGAKTVETVTITASSSNTSMNRGVNESRIDLAIGIVIGAGFGKIITSFVSDILMPVQHSDQGHAMPAVHV